ncbi:hypothetical protein [Shewanella xiamenensis]|uniref:hypothetical protein n=1 Tax=Shewanella xiamenensis TaxID=332186 RepID=UPI0015598340|nr:hypothetical protein [Shewanella xiamenensis]MCT8863440.1 hypothetical protein [Shewanella xiamenensis]MCT8877020.1 hypothetical protein [Shewanella xiamenensis]
MSHGICSTTRSESIRGCSTAPSDVNGFTNAAMAWMPKSGLGADGRLANHHDSPF